LEKKRREGRSEKTVSKAEWLFSLAIPAPALCPIAKITAPEVLAVLRQVDSKGRLEMARRLRAIIGQAFRFAVATDRATSDPPEWPLPELDAIEEPSPFCMFTSLPQRLDIVADMALESPPPGVQTRTGRNCAPYPSALRP
jgi:hypothetical protein